MNAAGEIAILDLEPAATDFLSEAIAGLSQPARTLPCKYFYDKAGADLFRKICELPEYHITRTETELLRRFAPEMAASIGANAELVGFGTGAGMKTRMLLEHLDTPVAYVPVDISKQRLVESAIELSRLLPALEILPVCADYLQPFRLPTPSRVPDHIAVYFPGSTIGNFEPKSAIAFLKRLRQLCGSSGGMIIGIDLQRSRELMEAAYNDALGVTAQFNLNLLVRANRELGADFNLDQWQHRAVYNEREGRIEMQLVSLRAQTARLDGKVFAFDAAETITTEYSYKYTIDGFTGMAQAAGFRLARYWTDPQEWFAVFHCPVAE